MFRLSRFRTKYLDIELTRLRNLRIRIVERPGIWMAPEERGRLIDDLNAVVAATVPHGVLDYGVLTGDKQRLDKAILTVIYDGDTGRPVAFNALSILTVTLRAREEEVVHLGLAMVDPNFRSKGLSWVLYGLTIMLIFSHRQLRCLWVSNVTQVPSVVGMMAERFDRVFPCPHRKSRRTHDHFVIAQQIMQHHRGVFGVAPTAGFDAERFIITDAYTGGSDNLKKTYEATPKHRNDIYNQMCLEQLDYQRGDDFLQLGQFTVPAARRYLLRSVPRSSLGWILRQALFLLIGATLLPVLHWFTPSKQLGDLRPWTR